MPLIQDYNKLFEHTDNIKKVILNGNVVWPTAKPASGPDYTEPFYVQNITNENETLSIVKSYDYAPTLTIEYKTDNTEWTPLGTTSTTALTLPLAPRDKVYLRCNTNTWYGDYYNNKIQGVSKIGGNIMSLLYGNNFTGQETSFPSTEGNTFYSLFKPDYGNTSILQNASDLLLPATTLTENCYSNMFSGCTSLTTAPALPATTLANSCYLYMFSGCTSLTTAPALPATTLTENCYTSMFSGCTSLTTAPALPATTLTEKCYNGMFKGCTSLTTAPALPATTLVNSCYSNMFAGCTSLTTAPALPATTLANSCYQYMFSGCTSLTTAPALPATTLANYCYYYMFSRCTSLTTAPALPATTLASSCYTRMFDGCVALIKAPDLLATTLVNSCYSYMFYKCTALNEIKCLATNPSSANYNAYTHSWLYGVSSTGTFTKAAGVTWPTGANGIPSGWTAVEV